MDQALILLIITTIQTTNNKQNMKKVFSILLVAVCCLALATPAQAQLKWGVKGGVNMSKIDWNGGYEGN